MSFLLGVPEMGSVVIGYREMAKREKPTPPKSESRILWAAHIENRLETNCFRDNRLLVCTVRTGYGPTTMPQNYWSESFCCSSIKRTATLAHPRGTGGLVRRSCAWPRCRRGPRQLVEVQQRGGLGGALRAQLRVILRHFNGFGSEKPYRWSSAWATMCAS
jgi:hypothetical protein